MLSMHNSKCEQCNLNQPICVNSNFDLLHSMFIKDMKNGKSPGIDGISNELFKLFVDIIGPEIVRLFNTILKSGKFPSMWCQAILIPLHKGGSIDDLNNYRALPYFAH